MRARVVAAEAASVEVVNIPEAGTAGVAFELVVHARDRFGNVDEAFEREVAIQHEVPPGEELELPHAGVVQRGWLDWAGKSARPSPASSRW